MSSAIPVHVAIQIAEILREQGYRPATITGVYLEVMSETNAVGILAKPKNMRTGLAQAVFGATPWDFIGLITLGETWSLKCFGKDNAEHIMQLSQLLKRSFVDATILPVLTSEAYRKEQIGASD